MKSLLRLLQIALLVCLFSVLFAITPSAAEPSGSDYDIWVGGVPVTYQNASDVLGDGKVRYDHATRTLTLDGATVNGKVDYYSYGLGIFSSSDFETTVVLRGDCYLEHGIRLSVGGVVIEDANVRFSDRAMTAIILYHAETGDLSIKNSTVKAYAAPMDSLEKDISLFYAHSLVMENSTLTVEAEADDIGGSLIHVKGDLTASRSSITVDQEIPLASIALYTEGDSVFTDCTLHFSGAMHTVYAPMGSLSFVGCEITVRKSFFALEAAELSMTDSIFDAETFYDGIYLASADYEEKNGAYLVRPSEAVFDRSSIRVRQLAYSRLKSMLAELWENMSPDVKQEQYGGSYDAFLAAYASGYEADTAFTAGISGFCVSFSILESTVTLERFVLGIYASGDSSLYVSDGSTLSLSADRAAFLFFAETPNALTVSDRLSVSGDLYVTETAENLATLGGFLYVYSENEPSYDVDAYYTEESPDRIFSILGGLDTEMYFGEARGANLLPYLFIGCFVLILMGGGLLLLRTRRGKRTAKPSGKRK